MLHKGSSISFQALSTSTSVRVLLCVCIYSTLYMYNEKARWTATCFYEKPHEPYVIWKENVRYKHKGIQLESKACTGSMMFLLQLSKHELVVLPPLHFGVCWWIFKSAVLMYVHFLTQTVHAHLLQCPLCFYPSIS